ncbi:hypothetical protein LMG7974_00185 [Campylobacter majalis]|uniref:Molybdopterin-guanine dinucleotide biosynthesis protein B (MobB) domain-containing protein n=1 Tax=Campylobacter majalis TaxID=2790656 RepID=A0ABM8Q2F6_9BACT|nr:molybdopterin-guanine dinucleotide biosynthesis protein B [Campylobacter majalis]CAD7286987.1 hypothetical protein LMG7974_00185 [Campylobacter majalis]
MRRLAVAFSGPSNSGKTTLILKVAQKFINDGFKVVVIKHDPANKAKFDVEGKDSFKFSEAGADVVVLSPTKTTYFSKSQSSLDEVIRMLGDFDFLLVEGLKTLDLPRISLFRDKIDESYLPFSNAIATPDGQAYDGIVSLKVDDVKSVCEWILQNAKVV